MTRRPATSTLIRSACRATAAEIRVAAMQQGAELDDEDRRGLFALAAIIERKATARAMGRDIIDRAVTGMIDLLDALDAPTEGLEPSLAAPERHPSVSWWFGTIQTPATDQRRWACGGTADVEEDSADLEEDDHHGGDVLDEGENSLGAPENHDEAPDQEHWAGPPTGLGTDCEEDHEGPDIDSAIFDRDRREARDAAAAVARRQLANVMQRKRELSF